MREIPKTVQVGPYNYTIHVDADAVVTMNEEFQDSEGCPVGTVGMTDPVRLVILMDPVMPDTAMRATLLHELFHAVSDLCDLGDAAVEEDWATRGAPALLDVLVRNPEVTAYLLGE